MRKENRRLIRHVFDFKGIPLLATAVTGLFILEKLHAIDLMLPAERGIVHIP